MQSNLPPKKEVLVALLEESSAFVHLDPRDDEVRVPAWFKKQAQLVLQIGLNMPVQIPDLSIDDDALSCTLSFSRSPHFCYIPWSSVYALVGEDQRGMVWPNDIPPEVVAQQSDRPPPRGALMAVPDADAAASEQQHSQPEADEPDPPREAAAEADSAVADSQPPSKRKLPPYLRVVK